MTQIRVIDPTEWVASAEALKSAGYDFFDQLGVRLLDGAVRESWLIVRSIESGQEQAILTRSLQPLPSLSHIWAGAEWCESEALAFVAHPLRRRSEKSWPGFADPAGRTRFTPIGHQ
ncbi:MAG: hypothetical protein WCP54_00135 [Actinomycetes bacterium]